MELKTLQSALESEFDWSACPETTALRSSVDGGSRESWKIVSVPVGVIPLISQCPEKICVVRNVPGDAYEVAIAQSYLSEIDVDQLGIIVRYDPTPPQEIEIHVYGICKASRKARTRWLQHVVSVIRSTYRPEVQFAYRDHTRSKGLQAELDREILIHDISKSPAPVQRKLARNLVFLYLNLESNHCSDGVQTLLTSHQDELLDGLQSELRIQLPHKRSRRDESQITSLFRALLELSGGKRDLLQHNLAAEYTANQNSDLYATIFGITRTNNFGEFDAGKMCRTITKSPLFSGAKMCVPILEDWSTTMKDFLSIGFRHGYLNLPTQVVSGLGVGQVKIFHAYLTYIYRQFPLLQRPDNNVLLLLTWSTSVYSWSEQDHHRPLEVLSEWAQSRDGGNVYLRLVTDFQGRQSLTQLALIMAAMMNYRRLHPDFSDTSEQPITGSYVADLDTLLHGHRLGNSGRVAERMVFALARELRSLGEGFEDLRAFLESVLDREHPPLHVSEGFCDEYIRLRRKGLLHDSAITDLAKIKLPQLQGRNNNTSDATHPEELSIQKLQVQDTREYNHEVIEYAFLCTDCCRYSMNLNPIVATSLPGDDLALPLFIPPQCYTLIRVTTIQDENALDLLDREIGTVLEVPSIEKLGDGSLEICILKSRSPLVQETILKILPGSHIDVNYDPYEPTTEDSKAWDYHTAKELRRLWFEKRADRLAQKGWLPAAYYYAYRLGRPLKGWNGIDCWGRGI